MQNIGKIHKQLKGLIFYYTSGTQLMILFIIAENIYFSPDNVALNKLNELPFSITRRHSQSNVKSMGASGLPTTMHSA